MTDLAAQQNPAFVSRKKLNKLAELPLDELFETVYREQLWGQSENPGYYSGDGSHDKSIITGYIHSVRHYIESLPDRPVIVDLGCGDFHIGSQLLDTCSSYAACDVAPGLIASNRQRFQHEKLSFHQLDACTDKLPDGDILLVRQVLQHLSNQQVRQILAKFHCYVHVIVTEHLPAGDFVANKDKGNGPDSRLRMNSGLLLEKAPFDLDCEEFRQLDEVRLQLPVESRIRTLAYKNCKPVSS
jgi:hypothetical protein